MDDAGQRELWERWLKGYWQNRLQGVPVPLEGCEVEAMLGWLPYLGSLYPNAVEYAIQMSPAASDSSDTCFKLNSGTVWSEYPEATARLLVYLAESASHEWGWRDGKELIVKVRTRSLPANLQKQLEEILTELGP